MCRQQGGKALAGCRMVTGRHQQPDHFLLGTEMRGLVRQDRFEQETRSLRRVMGTRGVRQGHPRRGGAGQDRDGGLPGRYRCRLLAVRPQLPALLGDGAEILRPGTKARCDRVRRGDCRCALRRCVRRLRQAVLRRVEAGFVHALTIAWPSGAVQRVILAGLLCMGAARSIHPAPSGSLLRRNGTARITLLAQVQQLPCRPVRDLGPPPPGRGCLATTLAGGDARRGQTHAMGLGSERAAPPSAPPAAQSWRRRERVLSMT